MNIEDAIKLIENKQKELKNRGKLYKSLESDMIALTRENFANSTDPNGQKWEKIYHRFGQPLIDTGYLMRSFRGYMNRDNFHFGTNVKYAEKHQKGIGVKQRIMIPEGNLPKRYKEALDSRVLDWLQEIIKF